LIPLDRGIPVPNRPTPGGGRQQETPRRRSNVAVQGIDLGKYKLGWHDAEQNVFKPKKGLNTEIVREISERKEEPEWMLKFRLNALNRLERRLMLEWFARNMRTNDFDDICYYIKSTAGQVSDGNLRR